MVTIDSLTETEIEDLTQQLCEAIASQQEWQLSENGSLYRVAGNLFFVLALYYADWKKGFCVSLKYKIFADDDLFWKILEIEHEEKLKMTMRISGAFNAPFLPVLDNLLEIKNWTLANLQQQTKPTLDDIENKVNELIEKIQTEQDHVNMINDYIEEYFREHPNSTDNSMCYMQILSAIRTSQWSLAEHIIRQRLALKSGSGVGTRKGTFYELAYQYLYSIGQSSPEGVPLVADPGRQPRFEAMEEFVSDMMINTIDNFGETDESVYWVEIYLMDTEPDRHNNQVDIFGAWLGQYLVKHLDGEWSKTALGWGVSIGKDEPCYPYTQVEKFLKSGQSESLCQFVEDVRQSAEVR